MDLYHIAAQLVRTALAVASLLAASGASAVRADITLVEHGRSEYRIVIAANPLPSEQYAAEELQKYLERIAGVRLPIVADGEPRTDREIVLGSATPPGESRAESAQAPILDGFTLRTAGERLAIAGEGPRGTLYGVYALLEEKLGVRWFAPDAEIVPRMESVVLPALSETHNPAFEYREVFWSEFMQNADFAARHRLNGNSYSLADKHGGRMAVYHPFVHSFDLLVPPALFESHPEYFPLIDGERRGGYVQRCLSNPDVLRMSTERVEQWIQEHPEATIISVSQNDAFNNCQCPECKAIDDAEGSPAASLLRFVNAIAAAVEKQHPQIRIDTLAYQYTRKPPKTIRPHKNVIMRLCSIECCFAHPLDQCPAEENRRFVEDIRAWQPIAPRLYVWDYTTNFGHYQQPFPNLHALQANVQFFVNHGVKGLFEQGNYSRGGHGEMEPLRAYLLAKLLWDPDADVQRHADEFLKAYYGNAAEKIRQYLDLAEQQVETKGAHAHIFDRPTAPYLTDELLDQAERLFDEAEGLAENAAVRQRVQTARLPIWYVKLATNRVGGEQRSETLKRFLAVAREAGISHISEGRSLEDWAEEMGAAGR
ncbi:MAG: DUF4838 domain-containing protein [Pirellulales bacterium]|nr:DUF4838 domain-containing protein [Pirellulales bacterium]